MDLIRIDLEDLNSYDAARIEAIQNTIDCYQILNDLIATDAYVVGGFALALLFGRIKNELINEEMYSDIDVINYNQPIEYLCFQNDLKKVWESDNAQTYANDFMTIQYIKLYQPDAPFFQSYDLVNSKIMYSLKGNYFLLDKELMLIMTRNYVQISDWIINKQFDRCLEPWSEDVRYRTFNRIVKYGIE